MGMSKQVVNATEANRDPGAECDGLALARKMANRTFSLATDKVYISPLKARNLDADIFAFNFSARTLQVKENAPPPVISENFHLKFLIPNMHACCWAMFFDVKMSIFLGLGFQYSPLWKITHQNPSVLCTPPPLWKITVFDGCLFWGGRLFRQIW